MQQKMSKIFSLVLGVALLTGIVFSIATAGDITATQDVTHQKTDQVKKQASVVSPDAASGQKASSNTDGVPSVYFPVTSYEFPPVVEGKKAYYDFVVMNKGTAELKINRVKTG